MCILTVMHLTGEESFCYAKVLVKFLSHLHMKNMLVCILYRGFVMEMVGPL
jgi:hypothetical protein